MDLTTIIVTHIVARSKTAFARREDNGEQVFIAPSWTKTLDLQVSDIVQAKLVPNAGEQSSQVPWFAAIVTTDADNIMDPEDVATMLSSYEYPVSAEEAGISSASLQMAYQEGHIVKIVIMPKPHADKVIMWAADMERV